MAPEKSNLGRRNFLQMTGAGIVAAGAGATAMHARLRILRRIRRLPPASSPSRRRSLVRI